MADLFGDPSLFDEFEITRDNSEIVGRSKGKLVSQFETSSSSGGPSFHDVKEGLFVRESSNAPSSGEHNTSTDGYIKSLQEEIQKLKYLNILYL